MRIYQAPNITPQSRVKNQAPATEAKSQFIGKIVGVNTTTENRLIQTNKACPLAAQKTEGLQTALAKKNSVSPPVKAYIYATFFNKDMITQAIEINASRVLQGKEPYPILSSDSQKLMETGLASYIESNRDAFKRVESLSTKVDKYLNKTSIEALHKKAPVKIKVLGALLALRKTPIISLDKANPKILEKIYIVGHGFAGSNMIAATPDGSKSVKTSEMVVSEIKQLINSIPDKKIDIRMMQCESADRETAMTMNKAALAENAQSKEGAQPLARYMADALSRQGIQATVQGYHGLGVSWAYQNLHQTRALASDYDTDNYKFTPYRASEYRRAFSSELKPAEPAKAENRSNSAINTQVENNVRSADVSSTD